MSTSGDILHELKPICKWKFNKELVESDAATSYSDNFRKWIPQKDKELADYVSIQLPWQFALSNKEGTFLAVLQETTLEIRRKTDEYLTPIGKRKVSSDKNPKWRKLAWSSDGCLLSFSSSDGEIRCFDTLANEICCIPKITVNEANTSIPSGAVSSLHLLEKRTKIAEWPYELLVLEYGGSLRSYKISITQGFKNYHSFSFCETLLSAAVYIPLFNILITAFPVNDLAQKSADDTCGLCSWRLLSDYPFYRLVKPSVEELSNLRYNQSWWSHFKSSKNRISVLKMVASQKGQLLACIHSCGAISIWFLPNLKLHKMWQLQEQPLCDLQSAETSLERNHIFTEYFPTDISWCSDDKLTITRSNGLLTVCDIDSLENLLGIINTNNHAIERIPQTLNKSAKLANISDIRCGFQILHCKFKTYYSGRRDSFEQTDYQETETENATTNQRVSWNVLNYFDYIRPQEKIHKFVKKTYKLCSLREVTSEELYSKMITEEKYENALEFAKLFNLDKDRVFKSQWQKSPVTIETIQNYLLQVKNRWWVIHECCKRIPETLEAAELLLNTGIQLTDFNVFLNYQETGETSCEIDITSSSFQFSCEYMDKSFTQNQKHILELRKQLLLCFDKLNLYKMISIANSPHDSYSAEVYEKFRKESSLNVAIEYAQAGNTEAVKILLTYLNNELSPHWLKVLERFSESIPPSRYSDILPKIVSKNKIVPLQSKPIRELDWSESGSFSDMITPINDTAHVKEEPLSPQRVKKYYEDKIRKIESTTGLVDYALELLNLARTNNIPNLEHLQHNLLVLDTLYYELNIEDDVTLKDIENMTEFEKVKLLMSKTAAESFVHDCTVILFPFLDRYASVTGLESDSLLDDYLKMLSEDNLKLPYLLFEYVNENPDELSLTEKRILSLSLLCIYANNRADQIDVAVSIVESLPGIIDKENETDEELLKLHEEVDELEIELEMAQLLQNYGIEESVCFLHHHKRDSSFQKRVLVAMVNTKISMINSRPKLKPEFYTLLQDMEDIQSKFFQELKNETYLEIFAYTMLTMGRKECITEYAPLVLQLTRADSGVTDPRNKKCKSLSYEQSINLIIDAVQYYFNISTVYEDESMQLASACVSLVQHDRGIKKEKDHIKAVAEINSLNVIILPMKILLCVDKMNIIEEILRKNPSSYKSVEKLQLIAKYLDTKLISSKREADVYNCAMEAAFEANDYEWCYIIAVKLAQSNQLCWEMCTKICECEEYEDLEKKYELVKYSILQCPPAELMKMISLWNDIKSNLFETRIQATMNEIEQVGNSAERSQQAIRSQESIVEYSTDMFKELISMPNLMNVFQSSSAVLNIDFWKNTFNRNDDINEPTIETYPTVDYKKLTFPELYGTLHSNCCYCIPNERFNKKEAVMLQLLFQNELLNIYKSGETSKNDLNNVFMQYGSMVFSKDCVHTLCVLLLVNDIKYTQRIFDSLPKTGAVENFALLYYCLKFKIENGNLTSSDIRKLSPSQLVANVISQLEENNSLYGSIIQKYKKSLEETHQIIKLRDLGCGIDSNRFFSDEDYKIDSILGLAMYEDKDKLELALSLGLEHNVNRGEIVMCHVITLFMSDNVTLLTERLKDPDVLEILKQHSEYACARLTDDIYDALDGSNYPKLLLFFALLNQLNDKLIFRHVTPIEHMKHLRKLKTFSRAVDYKLIVSDPPKIVEALFPVLFTTKQSSIIDFISLLSGNLGEKVDKEIIYDLLTARIFFNSASGVTFQRRLEICMVYFDQMSNAQIINFVLKAFFSEYSYEIMDVKLRIELLIEASNYCNSKKKNDEIVKILQRFNMNFERLDNVYFMCKDLNLNQAYIRELQMLVTNRNEDSLKEFIHKFVLDSSITNDDIRVVFEFIKADSLSNTLTNMLNKTEWNEEETAVLLSRIIWSLEDNEYEKCWMEPLSQMLKNDNLKEDYKSKILKILSILEQSDDDIYVAVELLVKARIALREWEGKQIEVSLCDVCNESSRIELLKSLLSCAKSKKHIAVIFKLLTFWPPFQCTSSWRDDPWFLILEKLFQQNDISSIDEKLQFVHKVVKKHRFPVQERRIFVSDMFLEQANNVLLIWFCILMNDAEYTSLIARFKEENVLPKIVEEYLRKS